jgi:predicted transcriptional regulator
MRVIERIENKMAEEGSKTEPQSDVLRMAVDIVSAYVSNNPVPSGQVPEIINTVFGSLTALSSGGANGATEPPKPAISVRRSVTPDYIVCLEDGKKLKMLKRHLRAAYGMSPDEYRVKWSLPADYPMVAPNYAQQRSAFAKKIGLGRKKGQKVPRRRRASS